MKVLERQSLLADRAAAQAMLARIPPNDPLGRMSFEARLGEIDQRLRELEGQEDHLGSVALVFQGAPVFGSHSIDAAFTSDVLKTFQDMVSKCVAAEGAGELGERGPLPVRAATGLSISNMVRGSVGFLLEEQAANASLTDSVVKRAIDDVAAIVEKSASENQGQFDEAIQSIDSRLLLSLREFFKALDERQAQVRIVEADRDSMLDRPAIHRARQRLENTQIQEREDDSLVGELLGLLPDARRFEMRLAEGLQHIRGTVAPRVAERYLELIEEPSAGPVGRWWRAKMKIREVREQNKPPRNIFTLLGLLEEVRPPQ